MKNFIADVKTTLEFAGTLHRIRKEGKIPSVTVVRKLPIANVSYWPSTPESCIFYGDLRIAVRSVFLTFPEEIQHAMTFVPAKGKFAERVRLWQEALKPVLPPKQYHAAIQQIIQWSIGCVRRRSKEKACNT